MEDNLYIFTRVMDCLRENLERLVTKTEFAELVGIVENLCVEDPLKLTKIGYADLDLLIEVTANFYENCQENIVEGIKILSCDFFFSQMLIKKDEFFVMLRCMYPNDAHLK